MADFARLVLDADTRGLKTAERDLKSVTRSAADTASKVGAKMRSLGTGLTIGVTAPLTLFGKGAVQAAIDAEELQSMFDTTFGAMSDTMNKWARETGDAMGRSTQELQQSAAVFQGFFKDMLPEAEAAEFSRKLTVLSQDVASFKNLSNDDAQRRLFAAATGEYESLKALGVVINDTVMKAKAMEMGFGDSTSKLTEQEKVLIRVALLQQKFADASGDVERTSDSMANQIKRAQANFQELQVTVGEKLIPILTPLVGSLASMLERFTSLPVPVQSTVVAVTAMGVALGPVLIGLGAIVKIAIPVTVGLGSMAKGFAGVAVAEGAATTGAYAFGVALRVAMPWLAALSGAVALGYAAWKHWDKIKPIIDKAIGWMKDLFTGVQHWLGKKLASVIGTVTKTVEAMVKPFKDAYIAVVGNSYIPDMVDEIGQHMRRLDVELVKPTADATQSAADKFRQLQQEVQPILDRLFPQQARDNVLVRELELLDQAARKGIISMDALAQARARAMREYGADVDATPDPVADLLGTPDLSVLTEGIPTAADIITDEWNKVQAANDNVRVSFVDMARDVTASLQGIINNIRSGDWLGALTGVLDLVGQVMGAINGTGKPAARTYPVRSFNGGGYTGNGARSGGLDGQGGFMAMLHPRETVVDHTRGQQMGGQNVKVEVVLNDPMLRAKIIEGAATVTQTSIAANDRAKAYQANRRFAG